MVRSYGESEQYSAAKHFALVCERYCRVVDDSTHTEKTELLLQLYRILPELILEATRLPEVDPWKDERDDVVPDKAPNRPNLRMTDEQWGGLYRLLGEKFGELTFYWQVFNPISDKEAVVGSLADDIADVYRDIIEGVRLLDAQAVGPEEIIWDWRLLFHSHWGNHAIQAFLAIHWLLEYKLTDRE